MTCLNSFSVSCFPLSPSSTRGLTTIGRSMPNFFINDAYLSVPECLHRLSHLLPLPPLLWKTSHRGNIVSKPPFPATPLKNLQAQLSISKSLQCAMHCDRHVRCIISLVPLRSEVPHPYTHSGSQSQPGTRG